MHIFGSRYFRNNKRSLKLLGQWPFQSSLQLITLRFIVLLAISSILTPKLIKLYEVAHDIDGIIECVPMVGLHIVAITKYITWITNSHKMKRLMIRIQQHWDSIQSEKDIMILREFCERGRNICVAYAAAMFSILGLYLASPSVPRVLDIIIPLNYSRDRIYLYQTEYFVDQDEYYIPILIHAYMTVPVSVSVLVFLDNMFAMYIHHACGMFAILGSHLEVIHSSNNNENSLDKTIRSKIIHHKIVRCANIHCSVIEFANELESSYAIAYLLMFGVNLSMITVTGIVTVMKLNQPSEMIKFLAFTVGEIFHVFFSCFQGQELIEQSERVFNAAYNSEWYKIPARDQTLLIPIMIRSMKPCAVTAGKLYPISMGTFSVVLKNALSFFTVLSSMR